MSPAATVRLRRAMRTRRETEARNAALRQAGRDLRAQAAGQARPELAEPFLDEARMFESAVRPLPAL